MVTNKGYYIDDIVRGIIDKYMVYFLNLISVIFNRIVIDEFVGDHLICLI